jgi:hypothetical protein
MASQFAQAVQCLVAERDRVFVERVAADYGLPLEELKATYLECAEAAIKIPRQYKKREPKSVTVVSEGAKPAKEPKAKAVKQCCTAQTSKKEPCKFSALKGEVFCKRHLKASLGGDAPAAPALKKAAPKKTKEAAPEHTHPLDASDEACTLCTSHGNPLEEADKGFEVVAPHTGPVKTPTVAERLAALLAESEEEASESEEEVSLEEEYEDDD